MTRKKRTLTDEEKSLWERIAQHIQPLKAKKGKTVHQEDPQDQGLGCSDGIFEHLRKSFPLSNIRPSCEHLSVSSSSTRRIQRVRNVKISARLDLHGYTREQAFLRLSQFLRSCQERGFIWVLVITGKGGRHLNNKDSQESPKKILRELVPQWLDAPDLRSIVSAYAVAKPQDGGAGALYVRLKRKT